MTDTTAGAGERERFEAWAIKEGLAYDRDSGRLRWIDSSDRGDAAWHGWKARAALPAQDSERAIADRLAQALVALLQDTQHKEHADCEDGPCPVKDARELLAAYREARKETT